MPARSLCPHLSARAAAAVDGAPRPAGRGQHPAAAVLGRADRRRARRGADVLVQPGDNEATYSRAGHAGGAGRRAAWFTMGVHFEDAWLGASPAIGRHWKSCRWPRTCRCAAPSKPRRRRPCAHGSHPRRPDRPPRLDRPAACGAHGRNGSPMPWRGWIRRGPERYHAEAELLAELLGAARGNRDTARAVRVARSSYSIPPGAISPTPTGSHNCRSRSAAASPGRGDLAEVIRRGARPDVQARYSCSTSSASAARPRCPGARRHWWRLTRWPSITSTICGGLRRAWPRRSADPANGAVTPRSASGRELRLTATGPTSVENVDARGRGA
jgi:hypothetical protein